jgi:hypothetical protein
MRRPGPDWLSLTWAAGQITGTDQPGVDQHVTSFTAGADR